MVAPVILTAFLICLIQPGVIPDPFHVGAQWSWVVLCYVTAGLIFPAQLFTRRVWERSALDVFIIAYLMAVLVTWPTAFNGQQTLTALVALVGHVGIFGATRLVLAERPFVARLIITILVVGIALTEAIAANYHLEQGLEGRTGAYPRPPGWSGYPELGLLGVIQFGLLLASLEAARSAPIRLALLCLTLVNLLELGLLYSRMAWFSALVVAFVAGGRAGRAGQLRTYAAVIAVAALVGGGLLWSSPMVGTVVKSLLGHEAPEVEISSPYGKRLDIWRGVVRLIGDYPLAGVGLGNFQAVYEPTYNLVPGEEGRRFSAHAHNLWLHQTAELGLIGGATYVVLWGAALLPGRKRAAGDSTATRPATTAAFYALVGVAARSLGDNMFYTMGGPGARLETLTWVLFALVAALTRSRGKTASWLRVSSRTHSANSPRTSECFACGATTCLHDDGGAEAREQTLHDIRAPRPVHSRGVGRLGQRAPLRRAGLRRALEIDRDPIPPTQAEGDSKVSLWREHQASRQRWQPRTGRRRPGFAHPARSGVGPHAAADTSPEMRFSWVADRAASRGSAGNLDHCLSEIVS